MSDEWTKGLVGLFALLILLSLFVLFGLWAFSWSTHTLVWFIFIFGSLFGSVKLK